jgi:hypothetical protein
MKSTKRGLKAQLVAARKAQKLERRRCKAWREQANRYFQRVLELRSERDELYCKLNTNTPQPAPATQVWHGTGVFERDDAPVDVQDEPSTSDANINDMLAAARKYGLDNVAALVKFWYDHSLSQGDAHHEVEQERDQLRRQLETQDGELAAVREERAKLLAQVREQEEGQVQYGVWLEWTYPEPGSGWMLNAAGEPVISNGFYAAAAVAEKIGRDAGRRVIVKAFNP